MLVITTLTDASADTLAEIEEEKQVRKTRELFILFALGSQFDHLIKQHLDRLGVYCLVADPAQVSAVDIQKLAPIGIILSGGPASVHIEVPPFDNKIFELGIPVLGICLGFQMWAHQKGILVVPSETKEFGTHSLSLLKSSKPGDGALFKAIKTDQPVLQSHGLGVKKDPSLVVLASTENAPVAAARMGHLWGVQFHPEVTATAIGARLFENFVFGICQAKDRFPAEDVAARKVAEIRETVGLDKVLLALSGGSDSSVVEGLISAALRPDQIRAVYIRGIDRPDDEAFVRKYFDRLDLVFVDATQLFLEALAGHTDSLEKRKAMRGVYKSVLEDQAKNFDAKFIAQGTIYTDLSESGLGYQSGARKAQTRLHHNTGLGFFCDELTPIDDCVKDSARAIGRSIGVPEDLLVRHPFPGPGLVVRIEGEVTAEKLKIVRKADGIFISELRKANLYETVWQTGANLTSSVATYTKGDDAGSGMVLALWAVWSVNGFTAEWAELPYDFLRYVSRRITNEIPEIASVVYRISDKPPVTIEWG